jgi:spermidine synthase
MKSVRFLAPLFFVSGIPALLYQVVWQRSLFALFGSNVESVTVVVAAFMLGLGLGSLAGGALSRRFPAHLLRTFAFIELAIGLLGLVSIASIHVVGQWTAGTNLLTTSLVVIGLVVLPTMLMGSTLPVLTAYLVQRLPNVGRSVGVLYFVNTLGSAGACFLAGYVLMGWLGQQGVVWLAAGMNLLVGTLAVWMSLRPSSVLTVSHTAKLDNQANELGPRLGLRWAAVLAGLVGFISLSLEIIWVRIFSFASAGRAPIFSYVIGSFLLGIALGSWAAERLADQYSMESRKDRQALARWLSGLTMFATFLGFLIVPAMSYSASFANYHQFYMVVTLGAASWGAMLPLLAHIAVPADQNAGHGLSRLYAANIAGAVAGSLATGFVLMEILNLVQIATTIALLGLLCVVCIRTVTRQWLPGSTRNVWGYNILLLCAALILAVTAPHLYSQVHERLLYGAGYVQSEPFAINHETRSGIVSITQSGTVYGSGAYDGKVNTSFVDDNNGVHRAFAISAFHAKPRKVLMIGLASGSWAQIVADHPDVESLQVVEINSGYLKAISNYPTVAGVLTHPKVKIDIDDGRRWLLARQRTAQGNPLEQFDLIVMNTTWNWRANASSILSTDFLHIAQPFLAPGGLIYYNATSSAEVHRTAATVFPHSIRYSNMVLASMSPIKLDLAQWENIMKRYYIRGMPVLNLQRDADRAAFAQARQRFLYWDPEDGDEWNSVESRSHILTRTARARVITDNNMGTEWNNK